ncbi:hypothetical protein [Phaffia rhodozyma]|uniref:Uncharacterized protein n=1 Tax=Phaffia rhodozyma TaxID=264483 RepID=A0A0F7SKX4_PHARH|nr:hypothetical protein [Phaffia rhodozyma]
MANIETKAPAIIVPVPSDVPLFTRLADPSIGQFDRLSSPNNPATNYVIWENRLESALTEMNIWDIISGERTRPTDDYPLAQKAWDKDDSSATSSARSAKMNSEGTDR